MTRLGPSLMITRIIMAAVIEYDSFVIALYPLCRQASLGYYGCSLKGKAPLHQAKPGRQGGARGCD